MQIYLDGLLKIKNLDKNVAWAHFGKLWEWATKQEWWFNFLSDQEYIHEWEIIKLINPANFAKAIYEFLKEGE